jgi:hypothetical protein
MSAANGTPVMPAILATANALRVTLSMVWFPCTVVTATSCTFGLPCASNRAIASSWPGSQSRIIFFGIRYSPSSTLAVSQG